MTDRTDIARAYFDAFARNDHAAVLALLTDDVVWDIYGHRHLSGKAEFDSEIETDAFEACDALTFDGDLISRVESWVVPIAS